MKKYNITTTESDLYITLTVECPDEQSLSWEQLQSIKDTWVDEDIDFIEVYPRESKIVNKANVRHLVHIKNWDCPHLIDLERPVKERYSGSVYL